MCTAVQGEWFSSPALWPPSLCFQGFQTRSLENVLSQGASGHRGRPVGPGPHLRPSQAPSAVISVLNFQGEVYLRKGLHSYDEVCKPLAWDFLPAAVAKVGLSQQEHRPPGAVREFPGDPAAEALPTQGKVERKSCPLHVSVTEPSKQAPVTPSPGSRASSGEKPLSEPHPSGGPTRTQDTLRAAPQALMLAKLQGAEPRRHLEEPPQNGGDTRAEHRGRGQHLRGIPDRSRPSRMGFCGQTTDVLHKGADKEPRPEREARHELCPVPRPRSHRSAKPEGRASTVCCVSPSLPSLLSWPLSPSSPLMVMTTATLLGMWEVPGR